LILEIDGRPVLDKTAYRKAISTPAAVARLYVRRAGRALFFALRRDAPLAARAPSGSAGDAAR